MTVEGMGWECECMGVIISANGKRERKVQALIYRGEHHYTTTKECIDLLHNQGMTGV